MFYDSNHYHRLVTQTHTHTQIHTRIEKRSSHRSSSNRSAHSQTIFSVASFIPFIRNFVQLMQSVWVPSFHFSFCYHLFIKSYQNFTCNCKLRLFRRLRKPARVTCNRRYDQRWVKPKYYINHIVQYKRKMQIKEEAAMNDFSLCSVGNVIVGVDMRDLCAFMCDCVCAVQCICRIVLCVSNGNPYGCPR